MDNAWWKDVEAVIERHSLLKHPFYQAWQAGKLTMDDLRHYAAQYYPHVAAFPRYVSAVHSSVEDFDLRRALLENLIEEERGQDNHPELWLRFAEGLGLSREEVLRTPASPETRECVSTFLGLARDPDSRLGLAALYAYESQIPAVSATKRQGLKEFYGIADGPAHEFFRVHEAADVWHAETTRRALQESARTPEEKDAVVRAAETACSAVERLLDGVVGARGICTTCS